MMALRHRLTILTATTVGITVVLISVVAYVALRSELRGYWTLINSSGQLFCSGGCVVSIRGDAFVQFEGLLGLSYSF